MNKQTVFGEGSGSPGRGPVCPSHYSLPFLLYYSSAKAGSLALLCAWLPTPCSRSAGRSGAAIIAN